MSGDLLPFFESEIRQAEDWHLQGFDCMSQFPLFVVANTSHGYSGFVIANQSHANQKSLIAKQSQYPL